MGSNDIELVSMNTGSGEVRYRRSSTAPYWIMDRSSQAYIFKLFTCFYALLLVIGGIVIELSNLMDRAHPQASNIKDLILGVWLFGGSIIFIGYCGFIVYQNHCRIAQQRRSLLMSDQGEDPMVITHSYTGSLYLRIGCVIFGMMGVIYYGLILTICILGFNTSAEDKNGECSTTSDILNSLAAVFIFVQMWFVFCNGKISFPGRGIWARIGLMHLFGTNLWMWLRYILYEEVETLTEIRKAQNYTPLPAMHHHQHSRHALEPSYEPYPDLNHHESCEGVLCLFSGFNEFMYTCVVEYSLICAGVAFVFWTNLAKRNDSKHGHTEKKKKRSLLTIDCSRTAEGMFIGLFFIIVTIIAIAVYNAYSNERNLAQWIFTSVNLTFFISSTFTCGYALWRMKVLQFGEEEEEEEDEKSAELLDIILLIVGLMGELIFSIGGLLSFVNMDHYSGLALMLFMTNILRLLQVTLQSGLILVCSKLSLDDKDPAMLRNKPGKQVITLLLMLNCAQFLMNVFEAQKVGVDEEVVRLYGSYYWAVLIRGCSPLTIFYRFHSSACFADIWKKTFKDKRTRH